ncbi:hypothetical protein, partial [Rhizobium leguminosarum]|uniref:hypothetical protein n=1 Tax=Rhizobium leguminosarum TaxID=384 RepID=UPI003F9DFCCA
MIHRHLILLVVSLFFVFGKLKAQDTIRYKQINASLFSNDYIFIKKNRFDKNGSFYRRSATDDGLFWFGEGVFSETNKKIILTYDTSKNKNRVESFSN